MCGYVCLWLAGGHGIRGGAVMPDYTYRLVVRPSGYREYHIERRGCKMAGCDSTAGAAFLAYVLNNAPEELRLAALAVAVEAHERSAA